MGEKCPFGDAKCDERRRQMRRGEDLVTTTPYCPECRKAERVRRALTPDPRCRTQIGRWSGTGGNVGPRGGRG